MSKITIKTLLDEDFVNYKVPSMFIAFPHCSFKCGVQNCQNKGLAEMPNINPETKAIVERYITNPITEAIVIGGLEPFDDFEYLEVLIHDFREKTQDPIVIYTGYEETEIPDEKLKYLKQHTNIIIKFGRYLPNRSSKKDELLGVTLASDNQYAKQIS